MSDITIDGVKIQFENKTRELPNEVVESIETDDRIFVLVDVSNEENNPNNILCYDFEGNLLWIIDEPEESREWSLYDHMVMENNVLKAKNYNGYLYRVDQDTGEVECIKQVDKR